MLYLLLGEDVSQKDKKIQEIKNLFEILKESLNFDFDSLDGNKLSPADLKKTLNILPVIAPKRLVVIKSIEKLSAQNQKIILDFLDSAPKNLVLILDSFKGDLSNQFIKKIEKKAKKEVFGHKKEKTVFDVTNMMQRRNYVDSLNNLNELYQNGMHPLQVMGSLAWFWGKNKDKVSKAKFIEGYDVLNQTDLNIKRTKMPPEQAVEACVVKLISIM